MDKVCHTNVQVCGQIETPISRFMAQSHADESNCQGSEIVGKEERVQGAASISRTGMENKGKDSSLEAGDVFEGNREATKNEARDDGRPDTEKF